MYLLSFQTKHSIWKHLSKIISVSTAATMHRSEFLASGMLTVVSRSILQLSIITESFPFAFSTVNLKLLVSGRVCNFYPSTGLKNLLLRPAEHRHCNPEPSLYRSLSVSTVIWHAFTAKKFTLHEKETSFRFDDKVYESARKTVLWILYRPRLGNCQPSWK